MTLEVLGEKRKGKGRELHYALAWTDLTYGSVGRPADAR